MPVRLEYGDIEVLFIIFIMDCRQSRMLVDNDMLLSTFVGSLLMQAAPVKSAATLIIIPPTKLISLSHHQGA